MGVLYASVVELERTPHKCDCCTDSRRFTQRPTVEDILRDGKFETLGDHLAGEDYIQHNPRFADGISGLVAAVTALAEQGITMSYKGISQTVAEGDFGYTRSEGQFGGQPFIFHDLFRVIDGKCVEHWDVMVPADA
jgi:predicted SnoaL-like aldol condensation-catalyzing enzyme